MVDSHLSNIFVSTFDTGEEGRCLCINGEFHDPLATFGGFKQSGFGREFGVFGLEAYLKPCTVMVTRSW